jgi:uncharacterized alkaline shock family protein YloU
MTATAAQSPAESPAAPDPEEPAAGRNELGTITIADSVVAKLAAQAALEVPDAGAAAPRLLGRSLSGAGGLGVRQTSLSALPKVSAKVDNSIALIRLDISVRWPASVPAVTSAVREQVRTRLVTLTGLDVAEVTIRVTDLVAPATASTASTRSRVR